MADAVHADTLIAIKAYYEGTSRRFKLPLRDLGAYTFPEKVKFYSPGSLSISLCQVFTSNPYVYTTCFDLTANCCCLSP